MGKSVHIRNRNGRLYIETYLYGRQTRRALGLTLTGNRRLDSQVLKLAEIIRSRREMQLACTEWGIPDILSSGKLLIIYIEENLKKRPQITLKNCLRYLERYPNGDIQLSQITARWVEDFQRWLLNESGLSQGSASLYASALRHQLKLAVRDNLLCKNPAECVKNISMPESRKQPLSYTELKNLSKIPIAGKLGREIRKAFLFSCFTGLRVSDLKELTWNMIRRHEDGTLWLRKVQKKTGNRVEIPLCESALSAIAYARRDPAEEENGLCKSRFIFPFLALTKSNTDQYLKKWGEKAGIPHVSWHTARHTMATLALENGAEIRTVSELLGHTNISTTLRYAKATDSLKKRAVDSLPKITIVLTQ